MTTNTPDFLSADNGRTLQGSSRPTGGERWSHGARAAGQRILLLIAFFSATAAWADLHIPASTAYLDPDPRGAKVSPNGIAGWANPGSKVSWFAEVAKPGTLIAGLKLHVPKGVTAHLRLNLGGAEKPGVDVTGVDDQPVVVTLGEFSVPKAGYTRFELTLLGSPGKSGIDVQELLLSGPATEGIHFNVEPRRNAASVHLRYPTPKDAPIELFYNEAVGVTEPVASYYMACGFARGYFGMQINSPTERRIIFSVWDSGSGQNANNRSTVPEESQVTLLAKGEGVVADVFGNEGTGGHSHLVYPWKTGEAQKFVVTAHPEADHTVYTGYWFHPEQHRWTLLASFRAPHDGQWLRGLYSFSENFDGANGHLQRKVAFGPGWVRLADGQWDELTTATFSHDPTGKVNRLDRFMGIEDGRFFLSNGGFVPGFTKFGERFTRPATERPPVIELPPLPAPSVRQ